MEALRLHGTAYRPDATARAEGKEPWFDTQEGHRDILILDRIKKIKPESLALPGEDRADDYNRKEEAAARRIGRNRLLLSQGGYSLPLLLPERCSDIGRFLNKVILGDCLEKLKEIPDSSIDLIATDPPYGIKFMGKEWDKAVPMVEVWKEALRVLKPGAFAFVMSIPRQDCQSRMIQNLEEAGFRVDFSPIYWTHAQGFPKAYNVAKGIEGKLKLGSANWSDWKKLPGKKGKNKLGYCKMQAQQGYRKENYQGRERNITVDYSTPEAKQFKGSYGGFQPKPAVEVILVAMKPMDERTYVGQALKNRKGITWLDDCRIPYANSTDKGCARQCFSGNGRSATGLTWGGKKLLKNNFRDRGRFPANLLISDDVLEDNRKHPGDSFPAKRGKADHFGLNEKESKRVGPIGDHGGFSRFYSLDAWANKNLPFLIVPKASKREKNERLETRDENLVNDGRKKSIDNPFQRGKTLRKNTHPTVKPIKLMSYLITMGSREGDVVLDFFCGSGSTCIAAKNLNRRFIGIDRNKEYYEIAVLRTANTQSRKRFKEENMPTTYSKIKLKGKKMPPRIVRRGNGDYPSIYRPCRISEVYGQDEAKLTIANCLDKGTLPHILLFQGVSGTGKTSIGRIIAMGLNCEKGSTSEPCGKCLFCKAVLNHNSFAFQEFNAGYFSGVDKMRKEIQNFDAASMGGERYKIILFDECQRLTQEAQAVLLKPTEDCHADLYFIFCTTDVKKMLDPLQNRCMQFEFKRLQPEELRRLLYDVCENENLEPDSDIIEEIMLEAEGMPRNALWLLQRAVGCGKLVEKADEAMYASFSY